MRPDAFQLELLIEGSREGSIFPFDDQVFCSRIAILVNSA